MFNDKIKDQYDVIYLLDEELGIESGHENERPCLVLNVYEDGTGIVIPITSQRPKNLDNFKHQLAFGSWVDLSNRPIKITEAQLTYSRLSDYYIDDEDIEQIEYRYADWV